MKRKIVITLCSMLLLTGCGESMDKKGVSLEPPTETQSVEQVDSTEVTNATEESNIYTKDESITSLPSIGSNEDYLSDRDLFVKDTLNYVFDGAYHSEVANVKVPRILGCNVNTTVDDDFSKVAPPYLSLMNYLVYTYGDVEIVEDIEHTTDSYVIKFIKGNKLHICVAVEDSAYEMHVYEYTRTWEE